jgi:DNA-binding phage protein
VQNEEPKMPLSREFKELVAAKAENDPEFRNGLIIEAINMILTGEITAGRIMLRDYINAVGAMDDICRQLNKQKSAICRMLGPSGNPTLKSIVPVIRACADREQIKPVVCIDSTVTASTSG